MSKFPDIMKAIAKRQLTQIALHKPNDHASSLPLTEQLLSQSNPNDDEPQPVSNSQVQPSQPANSSEQSHSKSSDQPNMNEVKQFFVHSQSQKLKILYPTFQEAQILSVAGQIWGTFSKEEKQIYHQKWIESVRDEDRLITALPKKQRNQQVSEMSGNQDSSKLQDEPKSDGIELVSDSPATRRQQQVEVVPENEGIQTTTQSEGDGRSNAETNTSSVLNEQSNHIALPLIYTLVECEKSNSDQSMRNNSNKVSTSSLCSSKVPEGAAQDPLINNPEESNATPLKIDMSLQLNQVQIAGKDQNFKNEKSNE